jgi:hypothetical protein
LLSRGVEVDVEGLSTAFIKLSPENERAPLLRSFPVEPRGTLPVAALLGAGRD